MGVRKIMLILRWHELQYDFQDESSAHYVFEAYSSLRYILPILSSEMV